MSINDLWKIRFGHRLAGQEAFNVWHFAVTAFTGAGVTDAEVAAQFDAVWQPLISPLMTTPASYDGCGAQFIGPPAKRLEVFSTAAAATGSAGTDPLPQQIAGCILMTTGLAGRDQRGFKYIPFPDEADNISTLTDAPSVGYVGLMGTLAATMLSPVLVVGVGGTATMVAVLDRTPKTSYRVLVTNGGRLSWSQQKRRSKLRRVDPVFPPP